MKRKLILFFMVLIFITTIIFASKVDSSLKRMDKIAKKIIGETRGVGPEIPGLYKQDGDYQVNTILKVKDVSKLNNITDIDFNQITNEYVTAKIPLSKLKVLENDENIVYIQNLKKNEMHNDVAIPYINSNLAHSSGYTGDDILIGVIDSGIDITHPAFQAINGNTRILYLWDQTDTTNSGVSVGSFSSGVGEEWTSSDINNGYCEQTDTNGHGTHVAGSIVGYDSSYTSRKGSAYDANMIIVKTDFMNTVDAVEYLYERANQIGKPIIVNMSLGNQAGPHDGTDLSTDAIDQLVDDSNGDLIVVRSAGNDGGGQIHQNKDITTSGTAIDFEIPSYTPETDGQGTDYIQYNFYYSSSESMDFRIIDSTGTASTWVNHGGTFSNTLSDGTYMYAENNSTAESYNSNIKSIYIYLGEQSSTQETHYPSAGTSWQFEFKTTSSTTRIDGWYLSANSSVPAKFSNSDNSYSIGNSACGDSVIAVTAYTSKASWDSKDGSSYQYGETQDDITSFSSHGPTRDERNKPDITAPGSVILSTKSSSISVSDPLLPPTGYNYYMYMQGTSMSSPVAAGGIALIKEVHSDWDVSDIISYFNGNSQGTTVYSGQNTWDQEWGYGVLDLTNALITLDSFHFTSPDNYSSYRSGENVNLSWTSAGTGASYEVQVSTSEDFSSYNNYDSDNSGTNTTFSPLAQNIFTSGYGKYYIRVKATGGGSEEYTALPLELNYTALNDINLLATTDQDDRFYIIYNILTDLKLMWNINGNTNINYYIDVLPDGNTSVSYTQVFPSGSGDSRVFTLNSSSNPTLSSKVSEGNFYNFYLKVENASDSSDYIEKKYRFAIREFKAALMPDLLNDNYLSLIAYGKGITAGEKSNQILYVKENSLGFDSFLIPKSNRLYLSDYPFNNNNFGSVSFELWCTMNTENGIVDGSDDVNLSLTLERSMVSVASSNVSLNPYLEVNSSRKQEISYIPVIYNNLVNVGDADGKIFFVGNVEESLNIKPRKGYKLVRWNGTNWEDVAKIYNSGYYAVIKGEYVPQINKNALKQNYPNPFNPETTIPLTIKESGNVKLQIFDSRGRLVKTLIDRYYSAPEENIQIKWDGKDKNDSVCSSGVYYSVLKINGQKFVKKMILVK